MKTYYPQLLETIHIEVQNIDLDGCDISIEESVRMIDFLQRTLSELRAFFITIESIDIQDEIIFFKEMKPEILGLLLYFNKIHNIELKRPNGSNDTQKEYYENELSSLTFFFERNLDFYQYYRSKSTYLDEHYFVRGKFHHELCVDSAQYIRDPLFSTGFDFKVAKVICNEMVRIYLNKKMHGLDKQTVIKKNREQLMISDFKWTASKIAAIELGYSIHEARVFNNGNVDVKEIMLFMETHFDIDLGDYYRAYVAIKSRKKDRTPFLSRLIEYLLRRMDKDDSE